MHPGKASSAAGAPDRFKIHLSVVKAYEDAAGDWWIEGVASGPKKDLQEERMTTGCIESMQRQITSGQLPLRASHWDDWEGDLGFLRDAQISGGHELAVKAWLDKADPAAQKLWRRLQGDPAKGIRPQKLGLSIGGRLIAGHSETENGDFVYVLEDVELDHVAVTTSPAYPDAWIAGTTTKAQGGAPRPWLRAIRKAWTPARWRDQLAEPGKGEEDEDMSKRRRRQRAKADKPEPGAVAGGNAKVNPKPGDPEEIVSEEDDELDLEDEEDLDLEDDEDDPEKSEEDDEEEKDEDEDDEDEAAKSGPGVEQLVTVITDGALEAMKAAMPDLVRKAMNEVPGFWKRSGDLEGDEEVWCRDQEAEADLEDDEFDDDDASEDDDEEEKKSMPTIDQLKERLRKERDARKSIEARLAKLEGKDIPDPARRAKGGERRGLGPSREERDQETQRRAKGADTKKDPRKWVEELKASDAFAKATPQQRVEMLKKGMIRALQENERPAA
jgi:hypothetical protein